MSLSPFIFFRLRLQCCCKRLDSRAAERTAGLQPGDVVVIPGGAEHEAWFREDTEVIDFFATSARRLSSRRQTRLHERRLNSSASSSRARVFPTCNRDALIVLQGSNPCGALFTASVLHTPNVATASAFDKEAATKARADLQCGYGHSADTGASTFFLAPRPFRQRRTDRSQRIPDG